MAIQLKKQAEEGVCRVEGCCRSTALGDKLIQHHAYETNAVERKLKKARVKTPVAHLTDSKIPNVVERNAEERAMCITVCVQHHHALHWEFTQQERAGVAAQLEARVEMGLQLIYTHEKQLNDKEKARVQKLLRRRLAELN